MSFFENSNKNNEVSHDKDGNELRKKREENAVEIRKKDREERFGKIRKTAG